MPDMISIQRVAQDVVRFDPTRTLLPRIGVQPPYFALRDVALEAGYLHATAEAESPAYLEVGPMPAAELGRHAAITGLSHAASLQDDDRRRYYLAQHAQCRYLPSHHPYGTPVHFRSEIMESSKRACRAKVTAHAGGDPLAEFDIDYTILTEPAFQRLFRHRSRATPEAPSPYGTLLQAELVRDGDTAEQIVEEIPTEACVGHFEGHPAMPVAVLMGQLSYLAGRLFGDPPQPYRVVRGEVSASDLAWAGESARFRAWRETSAGDDARDELGFRYGCEALAGDRRVGGMTLWLASVDE